MKQEEMKICQSCGMPLQAAEHFATEADGSTNEEYCIFCYEKGAFTQDCTMEGMIELCAPFHEQIKHEDGSPFTHDEAVKLMQDLFPTLTRWKK